MTTQTTTGLVDGLLIEVAGHTTGDGLHYPPARFLAVEGAGVSAMSSVPASGDQFAAARAAAEGKTPRLAVRQTEPVKIERRGRRWVAYTAAGQQIGYADVGPGR